MAVEATDMPLIDEEIKSKSAHSRSISTRSIRSFKNKRIQQVPARYLGPKVGSCHDFCKHGKTLPFERKFSFLTSRGISWIPHGCSGKDTDSQSRDKQLIIDVFDIPINSDKSHLPGEKDATLDSAGDREAKLLDDESTDFFQHCTDAKLSLDLASDHDKAKLVTAYPFPTPTPRSPINFGTRAATAVARIGSSSGKIGQKTPRLHSTRISIADKGKGKLSATALASPRTPRMKTTRIPIYKGKVRLPPTPAVVPARSVNGVPSRATRKHAKSPSDEENRDLDKGKPDASNPDCDSTLRNAEENMTGHIRDSTSGSNTPPSSELKGQGSPSGRIASTLPPLLGQKKSRSSQSLTSMTKSPRSFWNGNKKSSSTSGKSSSNSSSGASSSRPSTTSSSRGTSPRGTTKKDNRVSGLRMVPHSRPRRAEVLNSEDRLRSSQKPQFRRERVVDRKLEMVTPPRRLKFRRVRILGETQQGTIDTARKGYKRTEADLGTFKASSSKSERVVLRHQQQEKEKKMQNLFNNVIEETASKLVELRKSKVKALVGAFETVISL